MPNTYLLKTEPSEYSFANLQKDKKTVWDGVHNPVALRNLGAMKPGDKLITEGLAKAAPDMPVNPQPAAQPAAARP